MAMASMKMVVSDTKAAPSLGLVMVRLAVVIPSSRMKTVACSRAGSISPAKQGMPSGGSVRGGQFEIFATRVSIPSGIWSLLGTTRILVETEPAGIVTIHGKYG